MRKFFRARVQVFGRSDRKDASITWEAHEGDSVQHVATSDLFAFRIKLQNQQCSYWPLLSGICSKTSNTIHAIRTSVEHEAGSALQVCKVPSSQPTTRSRHELSDLSGSLSNGLELQQVDLAR